MRRPLRPRRLLFLVALTLAVTAIALVLLRPAGEQPATPAAAGGVSLIVPAKRRALPAIRGAALIPPPATIDFGRLHGEPAFVDVWASWCIPCREEAPLLARLARSYRGRVAFRGIDIQDERSAARAFVRRYGLAFPHIFDPGARLAGRLGVFGLPTAFLVDRRGRIASMLIGRQPKAKLERLLRLLAAERGG